MSAAAAAVVAVAVAVAVDVDVAATATATGFFWLLVEPSVSPSNRIFLFLTSLSKSESIN